MGAVVDDAPVLGRQAKRIDLQERITRAAIALFLARGFDNVTIEEIAAMATTSRRSVFRHFRQKDEILLHWMRRFNQELCAAISARPASETPLAAFRAALAAVEDLKPENIGQIERLQCITAASTAARAALFNAHRDWEDAVLAAFRMRDPAAPQPMLRAAAAFGLLALRLGVESWAAQPAPDQNAVALQRRIDQALAELRQVAERASHLD